jgi:peptidyl-prolyl cis-trans isomerase SurA
MAPAGLRHARRALISGRIEGEGREGLSGMRLLGAVLACALAALAGSAVAQSPNPFAPALTVNAGVITHYDIDQRILLLEALGARGDLRSLAIEQLTEDRVKVQAAEALGIELPEGALFAGVEEFAAQRGLTIDDVFQILAARGIDRQTMDDFVESGLLWREVVQSRFAQRAQPSEADLDIAFDLQGNRPVEVVQLREIALPFEERGEVATLELAEQLSRDLSRGGDFSAAAARYSRSDTARNGGRMEPMPVMRLPPAVRSQILLLPPGGVTAPIPISGGVAILKLDGIREEAPGAPPSADADPVAAEEARSTLRQEVFLQRLTSFGQGYLQELLRDALIVER